jgi:hypothetical protein
VPVVTTCRSGATRMWSGANMGEAEFTPCGRPPPEMNTFLTAGPRHGSNKPRECAPIATRCPSAMRDTNGDALSPLQPRGDATD